MKAKRNRRYERRIGQLKVAAVKIPNQAYLNAALENVSDPDERKLIFDAMKPHLRFPAEFPVYLAKPEC